MTKSKAVMKVPFGFKDVHHCLAVVLMCLDFRFRKQALYFVREYMKLIAFDLAGLPGASRGVSKESVMALSCLSIPSDLHDIRQMIIIHHEDCGAYGGSVRFNNDPDLEQEFHEKKLREVRVKILKSFPEKEVVLVYARLVDDKENVEFYIVE